MHWHDQRLFNQLSGMTQLLANLVLLVICTNSIAVSKETPDGDVMPKPQSEQKSLNSVSNAVVAESEAIMNERRRSFSREAMDAISETRKALKLLDDNNSDESLKALEKVVGKLEIILAKNPDLDLIPIDSKISIYKTFTDLESVIAARKEAVRLLKKGDVQKARQLLHPLVSEMRIASTYIPMASYPQAIKNIVPLIDGRDLKTARTSLSQVLSTLIVKTEVLPLPPLNAKHLLRKAQKLSVEKGRDNNPEILELIENARYQLKMAEALGYGEIEKDYVTLHELIDKTESRVREDKTGSGIFDEVKKAVSQFSDRVLN